MVKLFERNIAVQIVLIIVALALLWFRPLIAPSVMPEADGTALLYDLLYHWLSPLPRLAVIIAMLLVLAEGILLNILLADVALVSQKSLLPTLLYVIAMSAPATTLTPLVVVNALLIPCLNILMLRGTLLTISRNAICGATALIGIATMFYLPAWALLISYLFIAINYRLYSWKDWMAMLLGLLAPYVLLFTTLYLTDQVADKWTAMSQYLLQPSFSVSQPHPVGMLANGYLTVLFLIALLTLWLHIGEYTIAWQKNATSIMLLTLGGAIMLLYSSLFPVDLQIFAIPFALTVNQLIIHKGQQRVGYGKKKHTWVADALIPLTLIAALIC